VAPLTNRDERLTNPAAAIDEPNGFRDEPVGTIDEFERSDDESGMRHDVRARASLAIAWGLVVAAGQYAVLRAIEAVTSGPLEVAVATPSAHIAFFWRAATAGYGGGLAALVVAAIAGRRAPALARALAPAVVTVAALLAIQAAVWP